MHGAPVLSAASDADSGGGRPTRPGPCSCIFQRKWSAHWSASRKHSLVACVVCALVSLQNASMNILLPNLETKNCNETILMWAELTKLGIAACALYKGSGSLRSVAQQPLTAVFPVLSYTVVNLLTFWAQQQLNATLSVSVLQLKLLFTALFSKLILDRDIPFIRITALVALPLGVIGTVLQKTSTVMLTSDDISAQTMAILALVAQCLLSGVTSVYMQHIFSAGKSAIWTRNMQLAMLSAPIYGVKAIATPRCTLVLDDGASVLLAWVAALGGILAAMATLWASAIGCSVAATAAIVLTVCIDHVFVSRSWPRLVDVIPLLVIVNAVVQYSGAALLGGKPSSTETAIAKAKHGHTQRLGQYAKLEDGHLQDPLEPPVKSGDALPQAAARKFAQEEPAGVDEEEQRKHRQAQRRQAQQRLTIAIAVIAAVGVTAAAVFGIWRLAGGCAEDKANGQTNLDSNVLELYDLRDQAGGGSDRAYSNYVMAYLSAARAEVVRWKYRTVLLGDFLAPGGAVHTAKAGSLVVVAARALYDSSLSNMHCAMDRAQLRRSKNLWTLLNASNPLVVFLDNDDSCSMEDLSTFFKQTHHVLYRNTWSETLYKEAEDQATLHYGPSLRFFPYGTALDNGNLSRVSAPSPPASQRPLLFSFKGSSNLYKPSRELLRKAEEMHRETWQAVATRLMQGSDTVPSRGLPGRYLLDAHPTGSHRAVHRNPYDYLQLLRDSIFTLSPPGDGWEAHRTYEAMEAGSIPVVVNNVSYKVGGCERPAAHMLARMPFVIFVDSWDELPTALSRAMGANFSAVTAMQEQMRAYLARDKVEMQHQVLGLVRAMRSGLWKPRTSCTVSRLSPEAVAAQHIALGRYWRRTQPLGNFSYWDVFPDSVQRTPPERQPQLHRRFTGPKGWCALGGNDFGEECLSRGCGLPLIESIHCAPRKTVVEAQSSASKLRVPVATTTGQPLKTPMALCTLLG